MAVFWQSLSLLEGADGCTCTATDHAIDRAAAKTTGNEAPLQVFAVGLRQGPVVPWPGLQEG